MLRITRIEERTDEFGRKIKGPRCEAQRNRLNMRSGVTQCRRSAAYRANSGYLDEVLCHSHAGQVALTHFVMEGVRSDSM